MTFAELRAQLLDLVDGREKLTNRELDELESVVGTTAYFLTKERRARDARSVDECLAQAVINAPANYDYASDQYEGADQ